MPRGLLPVRAKHLCSGICMFKYNLFDNMFREVLFKSRAAERTPARLRGVNHCFRLVTGPGSVRP